MCGMIESRMMERRAQETEEAIAMGDCVHGVWHGDDMSIRAITVGCRIAALNAARKLHSAEEYKRHMVELMTHLSLDILLITECGKCDPARAVAMRAYAANLDMAAHVLSRGPQTRGGGQVLLIGRKWAKLQRTVHVFCPKTADPDRILAVEFNNRMQGGHNKLLVIGYYGYNDAASHRPQIKEMHDFVKSTLRRFKKENPFGSAVLLGDLNAAQWTETDTDKIQASGVAMPTPDADTEWQPHSDAFVIEELTDMHLHDTIRERYPWNTLVTRRAEHHTNRLLDRILVTRELTGETLRASIYQPGIFTHGGVDTDHKLVVADLAADCAGGAASRVTLWKKHKKTTTRWDADDMGAMAKGKVDEFNAVATDMLADGRPEDAEGVHSWLMGAATGTVLKKVLQEFPKKARNMKNYQGDDWKIRTGLKKMRETMRNLTYGGRWGGKRLKSAKRPLKKIRAMAEDTPQPLYKRCWRASREECIEILREQIKITVKHLSKSERAQRQQTMMENKKKRTEKFQHRMKKKLKSVITSIMRKAAVHEEIATCLREDGEGIATAEEEVAREVMKFYENWMRSKVSWDQRWQTWDDMMDLNVDGLVDQGHREFIELAYREDFEKYGKMQREHKIWDKVWGTVTLEATKGALDGMMIEARKVKGMKAGTAGGPTGLTYDVLKALDDDNLDVIREELQSYMDNRGIPKLMNRSLLRPLPKTDAGLADLALTRPIALMEVIGKLFEKILFDRIQVVLLEHGMLDESQHGGMPMRSTAPPMHNLAETIQDAQVSGKELHVLSADLSKAFDTLEHWSQAMSWRALGMPKEMAEMLMRMDKEGETAVILGQGRTTADILGEEGWFTSQRGVRQGSIGGPVKWIVYMNFWLKFVHKKHEGEGYRMSQAEAGDGELLGQMFIDDSNWFASGVHSMNRIIRSNETFVHFHGLSFNKKKCEYMALNQRDTEAEWERPKWGTGETLVETIRTVRDQDAWKGAWEGLQDRVVQARERMHCTDEATKPSTNTAMENVTEMDRIHRAMEKWEAGSRARWWAQDTPEGPAEKGTREGIRRDLQALLERMYEGNMHRQAKHKMQEWEEAVHDRNQGAILPGRAVRYLGVWYDEGFGWNEQRRVLDKKFADLHTRISQSAPTREEAVYCINATINSALKYPLRVAHIDTTRLRAWDTANRKTVSKAGYLPALAPLAYHTARDKGGAGLESMELAVDRGQVEAYIEALNRPDLNGQITRAGRRRYLLGIERDTKETSSVHAVVERATQKYGWDIVRHTERTERLMQRQEKTNFEPIYSQSNADWAQASSSEGSGREWQVYGDGATYEALGRAGWGVWRRVVGSTEGTEAEHGRLEGKQSNDGAEARAILQALLTIHPDEKATFYCDNQGCVLKWNKLGKEPTTRWGFRAIWNRIGALKKRREEEGTPMGMQWVHSHVDDEARRTQPTKNMACACRENGEQECDPTHEHHVGNEEADKEAKLGAFTNAPYSMAEVARGDLEFVLAGKGQLAQGAVGEWMKQQMDHKMVTDAATTPDVDPEKGKRLRDWATAALRTDHKIRTATIKNMHATTEGATWRFWIRAGLGALPTMSQMAKYGDTLKGNAYAQVYADHIGEHGKCTECEHDKETVRHALWECPRAKEAWEAMDLRTWHEWDKKGLNWDTFNWKREKPDWCGMWGVLGMVPKDAVAQVAKTLDHIAAFTLVKETAIRHLDTAAEIWTERNARQMEWEAGIQSLAEAKAHMKRTVWNRNERHRKQRREQRYGPLTRPQARLVQLRERQAQATEEVQGEIAARELRRNEKRQRDGRPLVPASWIVRMAEEAAKKAVRQVAKRWRTEDKDVRTRTEHRAMADMDCTWIDIDQALPIALLHAQNQRGQEGWWIPEMGTAVKAFWASKDGDCTLGGTAGDWCVGVVVGAAWDEGDLPTCQVRYPCGHEEWHCTRWAGTAIKLAQDQGKAAGGDLMETDLMPGPVAELLGPETRLQVRWPNEGGGHSWWQGTVVANVDGRIAVRYVGTRTYEEMIVWHDDLHERGTRIERLVRMSAGANEEHQSRTQERAQECVLLTDDGKCECDWCQQRGWPMQLEEMRTQGEDPYLIAELQEMGPREGRQEIEKRKRPEPLRAESPNTGNGVQQCDGETDARSVRARKRDGLRERRPNSESGAHKKAREGHREGQQSGQDQRLAGERSERRQSATAGLGMDGTGGERDGEPEAEDPGHDGRNPQAAGTDPPGIAGGEGCCPDLGGGERGTQGGRRTSNAQEGEASPTENGQAPDVGQAGTGIPGRSSPAAGAGRSSIPGSGPSGELDKRRSDVDHPERMDDPKRSRADTGSGGEAAGDEGEQQTEGWGQDCGPDSGPGGGMGINRDSSGGDGLCDDWSGQRRTDLPRVPPRAHQGESPDRLCGQHREEPAEEDRSEGGDWPDHGDAGLAITGVHTPVQSEQHEHVQGMCPRPVCGDAGEHRSSNPAEAERREREVRQVQAGDRESDASTGAGEYAVRPGEPHGEPLLGVGEGSPDHQEDEEQGVGGAPGGPMCIWKNGEETNVDPDEHRLDPRRDHGHRQVHSGTLHRYYGPAPGSARCRKAQPTDSGKRKRQAEQDGERPQGSERRVLGGSSEEQSGDGAGPGDHRGCEGPVEQEEAPQAGEDRGLKRGPQGPVRERKEKRNRTGEHEKDTPRKGKTSRNTEEEQEEPQGKRRRNRNLDEPEGIG